MLEARNQYSGRLDLARAGDLGALGDITSFAERYQELARQMYGGGGAFSAIWQGIRGDIEGLTGAGEPPPTQGDTMIVDTIKDLQDEVRESKELTAKLMEQLIEATREGSDKVGDAVDKNTERREPALQRAKAPTYLSELLGSKCNVAP